MKDKIKLFGVYSQKKSWCANFTCDFCGVKSDRHYMTLTKNISNRVQRTTQPFCNKKCAVKYFKKENINLEKWSENE